MAQIGGEVHITPNELSFEQKEGFDLISWKDNSHTTQKVGAPQLPVDVRTFVVPLNVKVTGVNVSVKQREAVEGNFLPFPIQPATPIDGKGIVDFIEPDSAIYQGTELFPQNHAEIIADYNEMGYHLVTIQLCPVEFDPVTHKIYLKSLEFSLQYETCAATGIQPQQQTIRRANAIRKMIQSMVENPEDVDKFMNRDVEIVGSMPKIQTRANSAMIVDAVKEQIPDYIIITNGTLMEEFRRLAEWKTQKGVPTLVKDIESIENDYRGSDLAEKVHAYLQECYQKWGAGLFVLLGGDVNIVPARCYVDENEEYPSDAYYCDLNSDWNANKNHLYMENGDGMKKERLCYVGRASVENVEETENFIDKILAYEKMEVNNIDKNYLMNHLAISAYISKDEITGDLSYGGQNDIDDYLADYPQIHKWYLFDHYNCKCPMHSPTRTFSSGQELNRNNFLSALQNGGPSGLKHFHIVYHMDHSNPRNLGTSSLDKHEYIYVQDVDNLENKDYPFIMISGGCKPAKFTEDCIAEHFLTNDQGGAVAFIGNANVGYSSEHYQYDNFLKALYDDDISRLGEIFGRMTNNQPGFNKKEDYYRLQLLGDPEMPVWSTVPQDLNVTVTPTQIEAGQNIITVQVNNLPSGTEATICLKKDVEAYCIMTVNDTQPHQFSFSPKTSGEMTVTVTAHDFRPFQKVIPVAKHGNTMITIADIPDFSGKVYAGGTYNLNIRLINDGRGRGVDVRAKLSSPSPYITIINDSSFYGEVTGIYNKIPGQTPFTFQVSKDAPEIARYDWNAVCFYLTSYRRSANSNDIDTVDVDTFKVDIAKYSREIKSVYIYTTTDGDLIPEPGERVTLRFLTTGSGSDPIWSCIATPMDSTIATTKGLIKNGLYSVQITDKYKTGNPIWIKHRIYSYGELKDSFLINIADRPKQIERPKIHVKQESDAITLYWDKEGDECMYNVYRSTKNEIVSYNIPENQLPLTSRYFRDEDVDPLTEYYYWVVPLTDGYFIGEESEPIKAWTTYPTMDMFPLTLDSKFYKYTCDAHTVDFDFDGQKEIVLSGRTDDDLHGVITVIRPDGTEPYDLDGNVTSYGGFAEIEDRVEATPAVADLYGNGENCFVVPTRVMDGINKLICYSALDKDGDKLPDKLWETGLDSMFTYRGVAITDIDAPDGKGEKEIIFRPEKQGSPILVFDAYGKEKARLEGLAGGFYGIPAIADLDGDGYKEIACGDQNGRLYVWKHDGTPYKRTPFFSRTGNNFGTSPIICDLDNDGEKEILIITRATRTSYVYAIKQDGTCIGNFDSQAAHPATIPYSSEPTSGSDHSLTVGDINGDGKLEVLALGREYIKAWNNTGTLIFERNIPELFPDIEYGLNSAVPILADVDGDGAIDIVFHQGNQIYALHNDGTDVKGFPLYTNGDILNGVSISDIDNDGKNEVIAADFSGYISAWKTEGKSTVIEWGRSHFNTEFTREYISNYQDPWVLTSSTEWTGGAFINDVIVRSGTFKVPSGKTLQMREGCRIYVMDGGTLEVDGGTVTNADVLIKDGGTLTLKNNGTLKLYRYGKFSGEDNAIININNGQILMGQ